MFLIDLHCRLSIAVIFYALSLGLWAGGGFVLRRAMSGSYLGAVAVGEILVVLEGLVGIVLVVTGLWPSDVLHFLYGLTIAISWPGVFTYTGGQTGRRELGLYALVSFFVFGLAVRAITTGTAGIPPCLPH